MFTISSWKTYYFVIIVTLLGIILYKVKGFLQDRGWCIFEQRIAQEPLPQDPNKDDLVMEEEKIDNDTSEKNGENGLLASSPIQSSDDYGEDDAIHQTLQDHQGDDERKEYNDILI